MKRISVPNGVVLGLILLVGFGLRLQYFSNPLADWHSFRQADTVSVAREFIKQGYNLLQPKYHDLSNIQSGMDNPHGYRLVEFPFINALVAKVYQTFPVIELHQWYRASSIVFSLGIIILLYYLGKRIDNEKIGLIAAAIFAFLPYSLYYSRTALPEIPLIFFAVLAMVAFITYSHTRKSAWLGVFTLSLLLSLLLKPTAIFYLPPLVAYILLLQRITLRRIIPWVLSIVVSVVPFLLWRSWIQHFPEGIPVVDRLLNAVTVVDTKPIRFRPAFFRWIFAERLAKLIMGYYGMTFLILGLLWPATYLKAFMPLNHYKLRLKRFWNTLLSEKTLDHKHLSLTFYLIWTISLLVYLSVFAAGNVQHDYYQILLLPLISLLTARGIMYLLDMHTLLSLSVLLVCLLGMWSFSWYEVRGYYNINNWAIVKAGQRVDALTPPDALVIAPYMGDTAFLYQTNRRGWPLGFDIESKIQNGADYYVSTSYDDEARQLESKYTLIEKTDEYLIIKLDPPPNL